MKYDRKEYERFLNAELNAQMYAYEQVVKTRAIALKDRGEVFVGKFMKLQDNGIAVFKVRNSDNMPRKNSFWTACFFVGDKCSFRNWSDESWLELRTKYQKEYSDAYCAWVSKSDDPDFCLIGVKNISFEFAELLDSDKTIIAFGPKDPPLKYILNLLDIVKESDNVKVNQILDFDQQSIDWHPETISAQSDFTSIIRKKIDESDKIVIQGPPGTGKTYKMAQLAAMLLRENKSILVTAFTNQALMELAKKEDLGEFLSAGKITKTSLTVDESKEVKGLMPVKENKCNAISGSLTLSTFYVSSGWAKESSSCPFDYVLVDEASQSLLPMIAASRKLGSKVIWIGDQTQLSPIVAINEDVINDYGWLPMVKGFGTLCDNFSIPSYMLSDSYRLMPRAAACTGVFYNNSLGSASSITEVPTGLTSLDKRGGPVIMNVDMEVGNKAPANAIEAICDLTKDILADNPKAEIAILSKFRETVRQIQKSFVLSWPTGTIPENVKIETVDRVQGLTVHYCLFFIPNASVRYSLEDELFNVATSRALYNTVIVSDASLLKQDMSETVRKYMLKAQEDSFAEFASTEHRRIEAGELGVTVVGKIDLSKFEKKRKEVVDDKENVYIIDTNVFVNCPNIITKIGSKYKIVIPSKVLEELDKLKLKNSIDKIALNSAAKNICTAFTKRFSQMEEADVSLLPSGFDTNNPDCMILSVALKHKTDSQHPILLTSDNILQSRAAGLGITSISLKEFLHN